MEQHTKGSVARLIASPPRSGFLLIFAVAFFAASIDEFAVRWTGSGAPRDVSVVLLTVMAVLAWMGQRMAWQAAIGILPLGVGILAYASR